MDLDGTALQNDRSSFSPRLQAALNSAHAKGIAVVPVTGRQFRLLPQAILDRPQWLDLVVLCNGGQIRRFDTQEILLGLSVSEEPLAQLLALAERFELPIEFSVDSTLYLTPLSMARQQEDPLLTFHRDFVLKHHGRVVDSLEVCRGMDVEKVNLLCIPDRSLPDVQAALKNIPVSAVLSGPNSIEITHPDADKGNALAEICRLLDIPAENTMAIGDSGNDVSMLQAAGLGVAMGNAPEFVAAAADAVTADNCGDGAAIAVER